MQYFKDDDGNVTELPKKNVDTGMGVERVTAILEGVMIIINQVYGMM